MTNGRPWFKFFPAEWLGSRETRFLTPEQRGYLIQLVAEAWQSEPCGTLPADPEKLWRLAGARSRKQFERHAEAVLQSFSLDSGRYANQHLTSLYADIEATACERRIAGRVGAKKRWQMDSNPMTNAIKLASQTDGDTEEMKIEEMKKDEIPKPESKARTDSGREPGLEALGALGGLARAAFKDKEMPSSTMTRSQRQARVKELRSQAGILQG
jgi:uncharacterized protein YdaU (DUF1376 family)